MADGLTHWAEKLGDTQQKETESLLIAAQNNAIRTNFIKARIDKTLQNSKCRLCDDRNETIHHIKNECSKLAQKKYKTWHDWARKVIYLQLCKKFKFDHTNKCYIHNPAYVLENNTQIQMGFWGKTGSPNLGQMTRPYNQQEKRTCRIVDFAVLADHWVKLKENEKKDKYLDLARELKKLWNMKVTFIPVLIGGVFTITKGLIKGQ